MKFPSSLLLLLKLNGNCISNVVMFLTLIVRNKNNYSIGPLISDNEGKINIDKKLIESTISQNQKEYPMDYSDNLNNCENDMELVIDDYQKLKERIERIRRFYPNEAKRLEELASISNNNKIQSEVIKIKINLSIKQKIIELKEKKE